MTNRLFQYVCFDKDSNTSLVGNFKAIVLDKNLGLLFSVATDYVENAITLADKTVCLYSIQETTAENRFLSYRYSVKALGSQ